MNRFILLGEIAYGAMVEDNEAKLPDIGGMVDGFEDARKRLLEHFKPTDVDVNTYDGDVSIRLNFRGFADYESAVNKVTGVASTFEEHPDVDVVEFNVSTSGMYDPQIDEHDHRPAGWVSAKVEG